ncbi:hypothetical protein EV138_3744 [Kribbella voronezhensis]|uniref:DUF8094 domain-containing protein n=1 Tax=Kribbella voronezhensis TaxID=2512212 RepID=A0A4R7TDF7_9ACTN|nr:hypothetical protein [Kribbella voronezhensis]TDU90160.1 hypothetical protein EV138_3744 [Kribbella voronezhensis]
MRFARVVLGLLLALAGLLITIAGAVAAFWLVGPDDTVDTGEHRLTGKGLAVMTAPDLLDRHGPTLHVTATSAKPVFVGIGQDLDVASYLASSQYSRVVRLSLPPKFETQEMTGGLRPLTPPAGLDWWTVKASGAGKQSISWPIADGAYDVVAMNADGTPGTEVGLTLGVQLAGLFGTCLLIFGAGLVLLVVGLMLLFFRRRRPPVPLPAVAVVKPLPEFVTASASSGPSSPSNHAPSNHAPAYQSPTYKGPARRVAGTAVLLLVATGCVAVPVKNTSASTSRPAVTVADGQAVVARYNELNNQANQARDPKRSEAIEGNPTLAMTRAGYQISRITDPAGKNLIKPFTYVKPKIGAPQFSSYPMRFVVDSGVSNDPNSRQLGVWQRQNAGTPWVLTHSVYPASTMPLPPLEGLRIPAQADMDKLSTLPQAAAANLAVYLTGGARSPKSALFTPSPGMVNLLNQRVKERTADVAQSYIANATDTFHPAGDPVTFITSAGEGLVFLTVTEQYLQLIEPGSNAYWTSGEVTAFSRMVKYTQTLHRDYLHQIALVIPLKGHGRIRVLSMDGQLVGAGGS